MVDNAPLPPTLPYWELSLPPTSSNKFLGRLNGYHQPYMQPVATVLLSELAVDWLKHAFITKFNHIRPSVYERYTDVLCRDLGVSSSSAFHSPSASSSSNGPPDRSGNGTRKDGRARTRKNSMRKHPYVDQSPVVARRLGLAALPLAILAVLIGSQSIGMLVANHGTGHERVTGSYSSSGAAGDNDGAVMYAYALQFWLDWLAWISRVGPWVVLGLVSWLW